MQQNVSIGFHLHTGLKNIGGLSVARATLKDGLLNKVEDGNVFAREETSKRVEREEIKKAPGSHNFSVTEMRPICHTWKNVSSLLPFLPPLDISGPVKWWDYYIFFSIVFLLFIYVHAVTTWILIQIFPHIMFMKQIADIQYKLIVS